MFQEIPDGDLTWERGVVPFLSQKSAVGQVGCQRTTGKLAGDVLLTRGG